MDKRTYACFKRCLEWYQVLPGYRAEMERDPASALRYLGFESILDGEKTRQGIQLLVCGRAKEKEAAENEYVQAYLRVYDNISRWIDAQQAPGRFASESLYRFANITLDRCRNESAAIRAHRNIRYFPLCFELSLGCRVQCGFCGLAAGKFEGYFPYTEENRRFWRNILRISRSVLGDVVDTAICYLATEPMDNPDYERFMLDFNEICGGFSQITTALAELYPERIRRYMALLGEDTVRLKAPLRFSVRNISQFRRIMSSYLPEELAYVEVLPNNPESLFSYSDSGRAAENRLNTTKRADYSICCIAGLRVNLAERTVAFIEPELPDEEFPLGYRVREKLSFHDEDSYHKAILTLYGKYALGDMPTDRPLCLNKNIRREERENAVFFAGGGSLFRMDRDGYLDAALAHIAGGGSFREIPGLNGLSREERQRLYLNLNNLYIRGYIRLK